MYYAVQVDTVIETGMSAFAGGPLTAIVGRDGTLGVVATNIDEPAARASSADHVTVYRGLELHDRTLVESRFRRAMAEALAALGVGGTVAVQAATLRGRSPSCCARAAPSWSRSTPSSRAADDQDRAGDRAAALVRAPHRPRAGGRAARLAAGAHELEVWTEIRYAIEAEEGTRVPILGDYVSGIDATAAVGGFPTDRVIEAGDPILCDLAPRSHGYWGDSCNAIVVGDPPAGFERFTRRPRRRCRRRSSTCARA